MSFDVTGGERFPMVAPDAWRFLGTSGTRSFRTPIRATSSGKSTNAPNSVCASLPKPTAQTAATDRHAKAPPCFRDVSSVATAAAACPRGSASRAPGIVLLASRDSSLRLPSRPELAHWGRYPNRSSYPSTPKANAMANMASSISASPVTAWYT